MDKNSDVKPAVREFINTKLGTGEIEVLRDDDPLMELGIIDSLKIFELIAFIESTFGFQVKKEDLRIDSFNSIDNIARLIRENTRPL